LGGTPCHERGERKMGLQRGLKGGISRDQKRRACHCVGVSSLGGGCWGKKIQERGKKGGSSTWQTNSGYRPTGSGKTDQTDMSTKERDKVRTVQL